MVVHNLITLMKLYTKKEMRDFIKEVKSVMSEDKKHSKIKLFKTMLHLLREEKLLLKRDKCYIGFPIPPIPSKPFITFLNSVESKENIVSDHIHFRKTGPLSASLAITNQCMYNCFYCSNKGKELGEELTTEEWTKVVADLQRMNVADLFFTGGEPLLRKDLEDIIKSISDKSFSYITSTGYGATKERLSALKDNGLTGLIVSFNSDIPSEHNKTKGSDVAFQNAVEAIKNSVELGLYTSVIIVLFKENLNEKKVFEMVDFLRGLGIFEIMFKEPVKTGSLSDECEGIFYDDEDMRRLIEIQDKVNKKYKDMKTSSEIYMRKTLGCAAGVQHMYVSAKGDVFPCDMVPLAFGNVKSDSIENVYKYMRDLIKTPKCNCFGQLMSEHIHEGNQSNQQNIAEVSKICSALECTECPKIYKMLR